MVRFRVKVYKDGLTRLPKEVRELVTQHGEKLEIAPNYFAFVAYPEGVDLRKVTRSLEIILEDLKNQAGDEE